MADDAIQILILGPMVQQRDDRIVAPARTLNLKRIVEQIVRSIMSAEGYRGPRVEVISPEARATPLIVRGVLDMIEEAELVVIDLSDAKPNVAYEAGIVHALGLPHILVCAEDRPPFYFQPVEHIASFPDARDFDPASAAHGHLRTQIERFLTEPDVASAMADNQLSQYFALPIIDISGPSGLASGYYVNAIRRFARRGGYFDEPCELRWRSIRGGNERQQAERIEIARFIAVRPPHDLTRSYSVDLRALEETLAGIGYGLQFATIVKRRDEAQDLRDYGGLLLARRTGDGDLDLVRPAIVLEIPTTLYALQYAPRIRRFEAAMAAPRSKAVLDELKRRRLADMMRSFERVLRFQFAIEAAPGQGRQFEMVDLANLPAVLPDGG